MRKRRVVMLAIALFPVLIHFVFFGIAVLRNSYFPLRRLDLLVHLVILFYVLAVLFTLNRRELFIRVLLIYYSALFAIILTDVFLCLINPGVYFPWLPKTHRVGYLAEGVIPGFKGKIEFSINKYGLRGPDIDLSKADFKIIVLGGSTSECFYVTDNLSWTWRLQDKLSAFTKKRCFVGSAGRSGEATVEHMDLLLNYKFAPQFDMVILLCGINDMGRLLHNDANYFRKSQEIAKGNTRIFHAKSIYYRDSRIFALIRPIFCRDYYDRIVQDNEGIWYLKERQIRKKALEEGGIKEMPSNLDNASLVYKNNLRKIIEVCQSRNQNILALTQPTMYRSDIPKELDELFWEHAGTTAYTAQILEKIIGAYNQALIEVCIEKKVPYLDIASILPRDDSVFYDDCHFNIRGCEKLSEILFKEVVKLYIGKSNSVAF